MSATAFAPIDRAAINRANSQHSTGPRTEAGKQRSSRNALRHGLCAASPVLPSEDRTAYEQHLREFFGEYQPATPTERHLVQELADTSWRLNRIPMLEAELLTEADKLRVRRDAMVLISDTTRILATLGLHGQRLSRQFSKTLRDLCALQAERRDREQRELKNAAAPLPKTQKHNELSCEPSPEPAGVGFVFSSELAEVAAPRATGQDNAVSDLSAGSARCLERELRSEPALDQADAVALQREHGADGRPNALAACPSRL